MTHRLLFFLLLLSIHGQVYAQCKLDTSAWEVVWSDEFDYERAEVGQLEEKWYLRYPYDCTIGPEYYPSSPELQNSCNYYFWNRDNIRLDTASGTVQLFGRRHTPAAVADCATTDNRAFDYSGAVLYSKYNEPGCNPEDTSTVAGASRIGFLWGLFQIRAKVAPYGSGLSAFWLNANGFETDVFETTWQNSPKRNFYATQQGNVNNGDIACSTNYDWGDEDPSQSFHTYTLAWTPNRISWFIDGYEIRSDSARAGLITAPDWCIARKMPVILSLHTHCWNASSWKPDQTLPPFEIDYIRVYRPKNYPGLGWDGIEHTYDFEPDGIGVTYDFPKYSNCESYEPPCDSLYQLPWVRETAEIADFEFRIFPNPVQEELHLEIMKPVPTGKLELTIINSMGQAVRSIASHDLRSNLALGLQDLPTGVYALHVRLQQHDKSEWHDAKMFIKSRRTE